MRSKYDLVIMDMGDEWTAVPVGDDSFHGMLRLNETSAFILEQLREDTTPERVHAALKARWPEASDREIGEALSAFLNRLIREGLLIAP